MKLGFALSLGLLLTASSSFASRVVEYKVFSNSVELAKEHRDIKVADARYFEVATKVEYTMDRHCNPLGDRDCTVVNVLERTPAIQLTIEYTDGIFPDHENDHKAYMTINLPIEQFAFDKVEDLRAASGFFGGHRVRQAFIRDHINFSVNKVMKTIQIVDVRNSKLCTITDSGEPQYGCKEVLVYKPATIMVQKVEVSAK